MPPSNNDAESLKLEESEMIKNIKQELQSLFDEVKALRARISLLENPGPKPTPPVEESENTAPNDKDAHSSVFENYASYYKTFGKSPTTFEKTMAMYHQDKNSN